MTTKTNATPDPVAALMAQYPSLTRADAENEVQMSGAFANAANGSRPTTPATSSAPQSVTAEIRFHADRLSAHLCSNNERTHDAASHGLSVAEIAMALAAKASALDSLVEAAGGVVKNSSPAKWDAFRAALTAAKAAQVSR